MSFLTNAFDKISDAVDKVQDMAADKVPALLQPTVHGAIGAVVGKQPVVACALSQCSFPSMALDPQKQQKWSGTSKAVVDGSSGMS